MTYEIISAEFSQEDAKYSNILHTQNLPCQYNNRSTNTVSFGHKLFLKHMLIDFHIITV